MGQLHFKKPRVIALARPRLAISEKLMLTNNTVQLAIMRTSRCRSGVSSYGQIRSDARGRSRGMCRERSGDWQKGHYSGEDVNEAVEVQREDQVGSVVGLDLRA